MSPPSSISDGVALQATVTRVIDGDTVEVKFTNGTIDTIRLLGVDTPETTLSNVDVSQYGYDDTADARDFAFNIGQQAKSYAKQRLSGEQVKVVMDPESDARGYYDRRLAYIFIDGDDFDRSLLQEGYARVYDSTFVQEDEYEDVESDAKSNNRGIWGYSGSSETETEAETPTPTSAPESGGDNDGGGGDLMTPTPSGGSSDPYDCSDFDDPAVAQQWFKNHNPDADPAGLDGDDDGQACEG